MKLYDNIQRIVWRRTIKYLSKEEKDYPIVVTIKGGLKL